MATAERQLSPDSVEPIAGESPCGDVVKSSTASGQLHHHHQCVTSQTSTDDEHPNATAYRRTAAAFRARDLAAIADLVDPDVVWHVPGHHPLAGDYRGREERRVWADRVLSGPDTTVRTEISARPRSE